MRAILKYPGSKWRIAPWILSNIPEHHTYVEPFFGSGAVFFLKKPSAIETVNDLDSEVVNLFEVIRTRSEELIRELEMTPYSREVYDRAFDEEPRGEVERARNFLIRAWQGHGFRNTGIKVGWKNDVQGREASYALRNWNRLPQWILEIVDRLKQVQIENRPALEVIERHNFENCFLYLDPPYPLDLRAGRQYRHEMSEQDHLQFLQTIRKSKAKIMISSYYSQMYAEELKGWYIDTMKNQKEHGGQRTEIIWMNYFPPSAQMRLEELWD